MKRILEIATRKIEIEVRRLRADNIWMKKLFKRKLLLSDIGG